jgi:hypothetical protein
MKRKLAVTPSSLSDLPCLLNDPVIGMRGATAVREAILTTTGKADPSVDGFLCISEHDGRLYKIPDPGQSGTYALTFSGLNAFPTWTVPVPPPAGVYPVSDGGLGYAPTTLSDIVYDGTQVCTRSVNSGHNQGIMWVANGASLPTPYGAAGPRYMLGNGSLPADSSQLAGCNVGVSALSGGTVLQADSSVQLQILAAPPGGAIQWYSLGAINTSTNYTLNVVFPTSSTIQFFAQEN